MADGNGRTVRMVSSILGAILAVMGFFFILLAVIYFLEEGFDGVALMFVACGAAIAFGGILLRRLGREAADARMSRMPAPAGHVPASSQISAPVAVGAVVPEPAEEVIPLVTPQVQEPSPVDGQVEKLILRSDDVLATLRDVRTSADSPDLAPLASLISGLALDGESEAPALTATRLGRTKRYWIGFDEDELPEESYDLRVSCEAALNVEDDLRSFQLAPMDLETTPGARAALRRVLDLSPAPADISSDLALAYESGEAAGLGEWALRFGIADFIENIAAPFRISFSMRANAAAGLAAVSLEVPRPRCMAIATADPASQVSEARAYALRCALLIARGALACSPALERVVVSCHEHGSSETLLSVDCTRANIGALVDAAQSAGVDQGGFPQDVSVRARFGEDGWFKPVEPHLSLDDASLAADERRMPPELDPSPASAVLARTTGAKRVADLGINEDAARVSAWIDLLPHLGGTTESAVSALVDVRDSTEDISVIEACARTSQALVDGKLDASETDAMRDLFINGSSLSTSFRRALELSDDESATGPERPLELLDGALDPIAQTGMYLDDSEHVFRFFGSMAERVLFNREIDDGTREVRLVPDAYYHAHSLAARLRSAIGDHERADAHADELLRIAPASADAVAVKVRVLENRGRIFDAADLLKDGLKRAVTSRDACLLHYRLAFMQWKLGRGDLAVASYVRAIELRGTMHDQAVEELADLLASDESLKRLDYDEARAALDAAGIPAGASVEQADMIMGAAIATCDEGIHAACSPLVGVLCERQRDDVLIDVFRSLQPVV